MNKLARFAALLFIIPLLAGCQSGLSEADVEVIVQEKVDEELASLETITASTVRIVTPTGKVVAILGADSDGGFLQLGRPGELTAFVLQVDDQGDGLLTLSSGEGHTVILLSADSDGGLLSVGTQGAGGVSIASDGSGGGLLYINGPDNNVIANISPHPLSGDGTIRLRDSGGQPTFYAP